MVGGSTEITASKSQLFRVYTGALGRASDAEGYNWWLDQIDQGNHTLHSMSAGFIDSNEFKRSADADNNGAIDHNEFVSHMHLGVFGRELDQGAYDYWICALNSENRDRPQVLVEMTQSNEYIE